MKVSKSFIELSTEKCHNDGTIAFDQVVLGSNGCRMVRPLKTSADSSSFLNLSLNLSKGRRGALSLHLEPPKGATRLGWVNSADHSAWK